MEEKQLEDIVLRSVYLARFFIDSESVKLEKCVEKSLNTFVDASKRHQEAVRDGRYGALGGAGSRLVQRCKDLLSFKKKEGPVILDSNIPQQRNAAQYYLNEVGNFYNWEDEREAYCKDIKDYLINVYSIDFDTANSHLQRTKKGLTRIRNVSVIGAIASEIYSRYLQDLADISRLPGDPHPITSPAAVFGAFVAVGACFAVAMQYQLFGNSRDIRKAKKLFAITEETKKDIEGVKPEEISEVLLDPKNEMKIGYIIDAPYKMIRELLRTYKEEKETRSFSKLLDDFLE